MTRTIRTLDLAEIGTLLDWAATEGWNPGLSDAAAFQAADPNGFLGAFVDGAMVAGIAAVAYDASFGFIGLYICHPDWRGQGHGKAVWDAGLGYLGDRTIGLDGVVEQQANYAAMGFVAAYETVRMSGTLQARRLGDQVWPSVRADEVRDLDRRCFPAARDGFLKHWVASPNRAVVHQTRDLVDAYAVLRRCREGFKIGPLFASDVSAAIELLAVGAGDIQIDVPAGQDAWLAALTDLGFRDGFRTKRMYRGPHPSMPMAEIFGVGSLELG